MALIYGQLRSPKGEGNINFEDAMAEKPEEN